jgi:hypothetical protein
MFSTFTTVQDKALVIQTADIFSIEDHSENVSMLSYLRNDENLRFCKIQGTATENLERLISEDRARSITYAELQHSTQMRLQQGLPALPVKRGKP